MERNRPAVMSKERTRRSVFLVLAQLLLLCVLPAAFFSCGGGGGGGSRGVMPTSGGGVTGAVTTLSRITGSVIDADGQPLIGVEVTLRAEELSVSGARAAASGTMQSVDTTDAGGMFSFDLNAAPAEGERVVLKLTRPGYIDRHVVVRVQAGAIEDEMLFIPVEMASAPSSTTTATRATVTFSDNSTQTITPQMVVDPSTGAAVAKTAFYIDDNVTEITFSAPSPEDTNVSSVEFTIGGAASSGRRAARALGFTGEVSSSIFYGDPTDPDALASAFPGEFTTPDDIVGDTVARTAASGTADNVAGVLVTGGFTQITLKDADGEEITSFADDTQVGVTMRVPDGTYNPETGANVAEGDVVPIFTYDEDAGEWRVEKTADGTVKKGTVMRDADGLYVPFTTTHLSWFNLDWKGERCPDGHPSIRAVDARGQAVNSFSVKALGEGLYSRPKNTSDGVVEFKNAPADTPWQITVSAEGVTSDPVDISACTDVTVTLKELNNTSDLNVAATCGGAPYDGVKLYVYENGARIAAADSGAVGSSTFTMEQNTGVMVYGATTDSCKELKSASVTTAATGGEQNVTLAFNNTCCPNYTAPPRISKLTPDISTLVSADEDVTGSLSFSEGIDATNLPDLTITLKQGDTIILDKVPADSLGDVSWTNTSGNTARTVRFTVARATDIEEGKNYSFTVGLIPSQLKNTGGAELLMDSYLTDTPGVVSYTATSVTGTFFIHDDTTCKNEKKILVCHKPGTTAQNELCLPEEAIPAHVAQGGHIGPCLFCTTDTDCNDGDPLTIDTCTTGGEQGACTFTSCTPACSSDANCDDDNPYTIDTCSNAGTCDAVCNFDACSIACTADGDCNDGDANTVDECSAASTCDAACNNCIPACLADAECDDSDGLTVDTCGNPGTCGAACNFTPCTPVCTSASQCDDEDPDTTNLCVNANTCNAACVYTPAYSQLSAGNGHTCALLTDGGIKCWGHNFYGQLGNNSMTNSLVPVDVQSITDAIAVAAGDLHTCAVLSSGEVKCWGKNQYGQLGNNSTTYSRIPVEVQDITDAVAISAGDNYSCALLSGGGIRCWGWNHFGRLGNNSTTDSLVPVEVQDITDAVMIAAGESYTCALLSGGGLKCWGRNGFGQLGDNTTIDSSVPVEVQDIADAIAIAAGVGHTCTVLSGGGVKCWGSNYHGELGSGFSSDSMIPVDVQFVTDAVAISAADFYTCAVLSGGTVNCWGYNNYGQLGNNTKTNSLVPVEVQDIIDAIAITTGLHNTCAQLCSGGVKCWGRNSDGQLGDGTTANSLVPVSVVGF